MPRLLVNPGSQYTWEIPLKPGTNTLGRNATNDFQIEHPSVSGSHCQIIVTGEGVTIRDLGSTNGTFLNHAPIQQSALQSGQTLQLGSIEMLFEDDGRAPVAAPSVAATAVSARLTVSPTGAAAVTPTAVPARPALRINVSVAREPSAAPLPPPPLPPPLDLSVPSHGAPVAPAATGQHYCKYHPKAPAHLMCPKCNKYYCDLCAGSRQVNGESRWFCRTCSSECIILQVDVTQTLPAYKSFIQLIPTAFVYPFKGIGPFFLILLGLLLPGLEFVSAFNWYGKGATALTYGFMYACLQYFIICTAQGDEKPAWPDLTPGDLLSPLWRFAFLNLLIAGPAIVCLVLPFFGYEWAAAGILPALVLAGLYFPMAILAVAMFDSLTALNPLLIIPSILKVPLAYLLTLAILAVAVTLKVGGTIVLNLAIPIPVVPSVIASLLALYLIVVEARILGLLYLCNKERLGWFS